MKVALSPSLLVWNKDRLPNDRYQLRKLAGSVVEMFDLIEEYELSVLMNEQLRDSILNSFPCEDLYEYQEFFADYVSATMSFLAKNVNSDNITNYPDILIEVESIPDIKKIYFTERLKIQINSLLEAIKNYQNNVLVLIDEEYVNQMSIQSNNEIVIVEQKEVSQLSKCLFIKYGRVYEKNEKHDPRSGWGSKLPSSLSQHDLQELLNIAIPTDGLLKCLVSYSTRAGAYIMFRKHVANVFHAYPVDSKELERIKNLKIEEIPLI